MRFHVVIEFRLKDVHDLSLQRLILDREYDLDALVKVSRHPVRGTHEDFRIFIVAEPENSGMLEEVSDDRADVNRLGDARDTGPQAADAADQQFDRDAGSRRRIQGFNDIRIAQRIHLRLDKGRSSRLRVLLLAVDEIEELILHPDRSYKELMPLLRLRITGQHIKDRSRVRADLLIGSKETEIRVQLGGRVVIVAGSQMDISADAVLLAADDHRDLAVDLEAKKTVDDVAA